MKKAQSFFQELSFLGVAFCVLTSILLFSHLFVLLGGGENMILAPIGFEGIKAHIISIVGCLSGLFMLASLPFRTPKIFWWFVFLTPFVLSAIFADTRIVPYFPDPAWWAHVRSIIPGFLPPAAALWGISEKYHGLLFIFGVLGIWFSFLHFSEKDQKRIIHIFLFTCALSGIYAALQRFGLDPIGYESRLEKTRVFAMLGNPNYYAGLLLSALFLAFHSTKSIIRIGLIIWFSVLLFWTQSLWGGALLLLTIGGIVFSFFWKIHKPIAILLGGAFVSISLLCAGFVASTYEIISFKPSIQFHTDAEKWKGFLARPYLWKSTWLSITENPKSFTIGKGPDSLRPVFETFRVPELSIYEDKNYTADRAHNWLLDIWHNFGILGLLTFLSGFTILVRKQKTSDTIGCLVWSLFFFVNIPVSANWIALTLLLWKGISNSPEQQSGLR